MQRMINRMYALSVVLGVVLIALCMGAILASPLLYALLRTKG